MTYDYADLLEVRHRDGIAWDEAPAPRRLHLCRAQTVEFYAGARVERCRCGASRSGGRWDDRNSRA